MGAGRCAAYSLGCIPACSRRPVWQENGLQKVCMWRWKNRRGEAGSIFPLGFLSCIAFLSGVCLCFLDSSITRFNSPPPFLQLKWRLAACCLLRGGQRCGWDVWKQSNSQGLGGWGHSEQAISISCSWVLGRCLPEACLYGISTSGTCLFSERILSSPIEQQASPCT